VSAAHESAGSGGGLHAGVIRRGVAGIGPIRISQPLLDLAAANCHPYGAGDLTAGFALGADGRFEGESVSGNLELRFAGTACGGSR